MSCRLLADLSMNYKQDIKVQSHSKSLIPETAFSSGNTFLLSESSCSCPRLWTKRRPAVGCKPLTPASGGRGLALVPTCDGGTDGPARTLSRGGPPGLHVLQQPLAAGGGAVLVHDRLRLSHQEVGEQDAARLEHLCKTASTRCHKSALTRNENPTVWRGHSRHTPLGQSGGPSAHPCLDR